MFELTHFTREQAALAVGLGISVGGIALMNAVPMMSLPRVNRNLIPMRLRRRPGIEIARRFIPDEARLRHTHIVGATGTGKSALLEQILFQDLKRGHGALIIDPKGDRRSFERLKEYCRSIGREQDLYLLSATYAGESVVWNPCRLGTSSELQSKFYQSAIYSEPHYAKACELALIKIFKELDATSETFGLIEVVAALDRYSRGGKDETVAGLYLDLRNLVESEWAPLMGCASSGLPELSILDVVNDNKILFVDLPTEGGGVQSARIGKLLLQEITLISGLRKLYPHLRSDKPFSVFVDEFDAFASPAFATFLNKGRSSDFMIHLAHQTLSDLNRVSPDFMGQIMGNMTVRFIFRQDLPEDAETWSKFFGTKRDTKRTYQTEGGQRNGMGTVREVQEFRVHPDMIKELKTGQCVFSVKGQKGAPELLKIPFKQIKTPPQTIEKAPKMRASHRVHGDSHSGARSSQSQAQAMLDRGSHVASLLSDFGKQDSKEGEV